ncbi:MAG: EAL domain-containing protein [Candidatus Dormibacteria bacterium]
MAASRGGGSRPRTTATPRPSPSIGSQAPPRGGALAKTDQTGRSDSLGGSGLGVTPIGLSELELLRAVVVASPMAISAVDLAGTLMLWNPAAERLFGWEASEVIGQRWLIVDPASPSGIDPQRPDALAEPSPLEVETVRRHKDGRAIDVALSKVTVRDPSGRATAVLGLFRDIGGQNAIEFELGRQARRDDLTGLLNKRGLLDRMGGAVTGARSHGAVVVLNLDHFKEVNDGLGQSVGDQVLRAFAHRLVRVVPPSALVARLDADTFAVVMLRLAPARAESVVARIFERLDDRYAVDGHHVTVGVSGGVVISAGRTHPDELLRRAAIALRQAKSGPRGRFHVLDEAVDRAFVERVELSSQLAGAAERGELRLDFQPIVSTTSGRMTGVEALVRWKHPELGLLAPEQFIPLAEETATIFRIGRWVLQQACATLKEWSAKSTAATLTVSVNVSVAQLQGRELVKDVSQALTQSQLAPERLHLEVTESVLTSDPEAATRVLQQLRELGVTLVIDDFGTGNSSLTALQRFPFQVLKIDKSFVSGIGVRTDDNTIVAATLALARGLGLSVVAEGVETLDQANFLARNGCEELQGYLLGRPAPASEIQRLLPRRLLRGRSQRRRGESSGSGSYRELIGGATLIEDQQVTVSLATALRPILEELQERTALESVYLTRINWDRAEQEILAAANSDDLIIPEGLVVAWSDTLCRRSLESGRAWSASVPDLWPDSEAGRQLGLVTYASVPVVLASQTVYGTLCGASRRPVPENPEVLALMGMVARIVAALVEGQSAPSAPARRVALGVLAQARR